MRDGQRDGQRDGPSIRDHPDGIEGDDGDPDGDGVSNKLEFLADLNPNDPAEGIVPVTPLISKNGATRQLQVRTVPNRRSPIV